MVPCFFHNIIGWRKTEGNVFAVKYQMATTVCRWSDHLLEMNEIIFFFLPKGTGSSEKHNPCRSKCLSG